MTKKTGVKSLTRHCEAFSQYVIARRAEPDEAIPVFIIAFLALTLLAGPPPALAEDNILSDSVGIGTTAPGSNLHVSSAAGATEIRAETTGNNQTELLLSRNQAAGSYNVNWYAYIPASTKDLRLYDTADRVTFQNGGKVGISTTSPGAGLTIGAGTNTNATTLNDLYVTGNLEVDGSIWLGDINTDTLTLGANLVGTSATGTLSSLTVTGSAYLATTSGNVGIGTTSTSAKLHTYVSGAGNTAYIQSDAAQQASIFLGDSSQSAFYRPASTNDIRVWTGGADVATFKSGGSVGIGTTSPGTVNSNVAAGTSLHVSGTTGTIIADGSTQSQILLNDNGGAANSRLVRLYSIDGTLYISPMNDNFTVKNVGMYMSTAGDVGIGTTGPVAKVDARGQIAGQSWLNIWNTGAVGTLAGGDARAAVTFGGNNSAQGWYVGAVSDSTAANMDFGFYKWAGTGAGWNMVLQNGNVGIGTTSPGYKLEVNGNFNATTLYQGGVGLIDGPGTAGYIPKFSDANTLANSALYDSSGSIGIGTTSPSTKLHTYNPAATAGHNYLLIENANAAYQSALELRTATANADWFQYIPGNSTDLRFYRGADLVTLQAAGNVGIGTTAPGAKLHVAGGDIHIDSGQKIFESGDAGNITLQAGSSAGDPLTYINLRGGWNGVNNNNGFIDFRTKSASRMYVQSDGNVGIGTTAPARQLELAHTAASDNNRIRLNSTDIGAYWSGFEFSNAAAFKGGLFRYHADDRQAIWTPTVEALTVLTGGNVGIGTTAPGASLTVKGYPALQLISTDAVKSWKFYPATDGNLYLNDPDEASVIYIYQSATTANLVLKDGNVGIGTTAPSSKLSVGGVGSSSYAIYGTTAASGGVWGAGTGSGDSGVYATNTGGGWDFYGGGTKTYFAGNVGIGTTAPGSKLDVNGAISSNRNWYYLAVAGDTNHAIGNISGDGEQFRGYNFIDFTTINPGGNVRITGAGNVGIGFTNPIHSLSAGNSGVISVGTLHLANSYLQDGSGWYGIRLAGIDNGVSGHDLRIQGRTTATGAFSDLVTVKNSGSVGIGTTNPGSYKLNVVGDAYISGLVVSNSGLSNLSTLRVLGNTYLATDSGSVGIGTTAPSKDLDIIKLVDNGDVSLKIENSFRTTNSTNETATLYFTSAYNMGKIEGYKVGDMWSATAQVDGGLKFYTINDQVEGVRMTIDNSGNVGIGTTAPGAKLDVVGTIKSRLAASGNSGGINLGTTASERPVVEFHVSDDSLRGKIEINDINAASGDRLGFFAYSGGSFPEVLSIRGNGNVGIGTTAPVHPFYVQKANAADWQGRFANNSGTGADVYLAHGGGYGMHIRGWNATDSVYALVIYNNTVLTNAFYNSGRVVLGMAGNVGIGTTAPDVKLLVEGTIKPRGGISVNASGSANNGRTIELIVDGGVSQIFSSYWSTEGPLVLGTYSNRANQLYLATTGNVGIGTTNPSDGLTWQSPALDVKGTRGTLNLQTTSVGGSSTIRFKGPSTSSEWHQNLSDGADNSLGFYSYQKTGGADYVMTLKGTGNVGIGTTAPGAKLHISGAGSNWVQVSDTNYPANGVYFGIEGGITKVLSAGSDIALRTDGGGWSDKLTVKNSGNVGIGTTAPGAILHTYNTSATAGDLEVGRFEAPNATAATEQQYLTVGNTTNGGYLGYMQANTSFGMGVHGAGTVLNIKSGNVGIGTTAPTRALEVARSITSLPIAIFRSSGTVDYGGGIALYTDTSDAAARNWGISTNTHSFGDFTIRKGNAKGDDPFWTGASMLTISPSGNVGIGTTSPATGMELFGDAPILTIKDSDTTITAISEQLGSINFRSSDANATGEIVGRIVSVSDYTDGAHVGLSFYSMSYGSVSEKMRIQSGGNVGIGTTAPGALLDLNAASGNTVMAFSEAGVGKWSLRNSGADDSFRIGDANQTVLTVLQGGSVGIGTTAPGGKLDVNGTIYQRGSVLHADYVFEPAYKLESIDDHATYMWQNKHLQAVPKAMKDESGQDVVEWGQRNKGILEELEKAHVYIQELNERIKALEAKVKGLETQS